MHLYTVQIPPTRHMGSYVMRFMCLRREVRREALADYNDSRAKEGLPPLARLPAGATVRRSIP